MNEEQMERAEQIRDELREDGINPRKCENCGKIFISESEVKHIEESGICISCCEEEHK